MILFFNSGICKIKSVMYLFGMKEIITDFVVLEIGVYFVVLWFWKLDFRQMEENGSKTPN